MSNSISFTSWVDYRFFASWSRCPFAVVILFGRCLSMRRVVRPGHDVIWFPLMAWSNIDGEGLKYDAERYCANSLAV